MRRTSFIILCLIVTGCQRVREVGQKETSPPEAYIRLGDRLAAQMLRMGIPWVMPCASLPANQCVKFSAPQRFRGLWRNDFEGSQFCPTPATVCSYVPTEQRQKPQIWLDFTFSLPARDKRPPGGLYAIDFVGRSSLYRGTYGHMGMSDHEVIVDRMISMNELEPPRKVSDGPLK